MKANTLSRKLSSETDREVYEWVFTHRFSYERRSCIIRSR